MPGIVSCDEVQTSCSIGHFVAGKSNIHPAKAQYFHKFLRVIDFDRDSKRAGGSLWRREGLLRVRT